MRLLLFKRKLPNKLTLNMFNEKKTISDDLWNDITNGEIAIKYTDKITNEWICNINYRIHTGQIGLLFVNNLYQRKGLGTEMLTNAIKDICNRSNVSNIWAVTTNNHPYWNNVKINGQKFHSKPPAHPSVTGSGYVLENIRSIFTNKE